MSKLSNVMQSVMSPTETVSLEQQAAATELAELLLDRANASLEQQVENFEHLLLMEKGLSDLIVSVESMEDPNESHARLIRGNVDAIFAGLTINFSHVVPALESHQGGKISMEDAKETLEKLWELIKAAAAKIWEFIKQAMKQLTEVEKALYRESVAIRHELKDQHGNVTVNAMLPNSPNAIWASDNGDMPNNFVELEHHLQQFTQTHTALNKNYAGDLETAIKAVSNSFDKMGDTDEDVAKAREVFRAAIRRMTPDAQSKHFHYLVKGDELGDGEYAAVDLTYDRRLVFRGEELKAGDDDFANKVKKIGLAIVQHDVSIDTTEHGLGKMKAMSLNEIEKILDQVDALLAGGGRSDADARAERLEVLTKNLKDDSDALVEIMSKNEGNWNAESVGTVRELLQFNSLAAKWSIAPFSQINTVTIYLVRAALRICRQHLGNFQGEEAAVEKKETKVEKADESAAE